MFRKRRRHGTGIGGLLVVAALLYFTGAGGWLWDRTKELEGQCYGALAQAGTTTGGGICGGMGSAVNALDKIFSDFGGTVRGWWDGLKGSFSTDSLPSLAGDLRLDSALARLGSGQEALRQRMQMGPQSLGSMQSVSEQVRGAVDSFAIGQRYLAGDGSSSYRAVPWLQQGATVPGYGVLSQLRLGDLYSHGATSVAPNPQAAIGYYSQAHQSIGLLQQSNTPEAQRMLQALPASPGQIQQQLLATIRELKRQ